MGGGEDGLAEPCRKPLTDDEQTTLLQAFGADTSRKLGADLAELTAHSFLHTTYNNFKFVVIDTVPKNIGHIKDMFKLDDEYVVLIPKRRTLLLKSGSRSTVEVMEQPQDHEKIITVATGSNIISAKNEITFATGLSHIIDNIPRASSDFVNSGMFSLHYLKTRLFNDIWNGVDKIVNELEARSLKKNDMFRQLGWNNDSVGKHKINSRVTLIISNQDDLSQKVGDYVAPSYSAVAALEITPWVILTNGKNWRLYTNRIAAVTTDYFQVDYNPQKPASIRYLVTLFHARSYEEDMYVEKFLEESIKYAKELEKNLRSTITSKDGPFFNLVKGVLDHDSSKQYLIDELDAAKDAALKIMYRIWFILYAESRSLLPVSDDRYRTISLQVARTRLDSYDADPEGVDCWNDMLLLFKGMRDGSAKHNLPQYNGQLFQEKTLIDNNMIKNKFVAKALRSLVEDDGVVVDYASLGVRNIGSVYEALMEISVKQAEDDIMVYDNNGKTEIVKTSELSSYKYEKGDLYLITKGGLFSRKNSGSYYTPEKFVEFLVRRGLEPLFAKHKIDLSRNIKAYIKDRCSKNYERCVNDLFDFKVVDPTMGSGHFLVEVLNQITAWATAVLAEYPVHPV